jgi:lipopolysaccharide export system protein LptA
MLRRLFTSSLFIFFLLLTNVFSEEAQKIKGPIIITSERLTTDSKANTALFENSVIARTTDMTLHADKMIVFYNEDTGNITKIEAVGGIKLIKGKRVITAKEATYYADTEKIIFTGEPRAVEDENVVTGARMTYFMNEDRFLIEDSKVFLQKKRGQ